MRGQRSAHVSHLAPLRSKLNKLHFLKGTIESLEPYRRYSLTVHVRPDKDTCNMKRINNSESTYGSTHFYFMEGCKTPQQHTAAERLLCCL